MSFKKPVFITLFVPSNLTQYHCLPPQSLRCQFFLYFFSHNNPVKNVKKNPRLRAVNKYIYISCQWFFMNSPYSLLYMQFSNVKRHLHFLFKFLLQVTCSKVCRKAEAIYKKGTFVFV